MENKSGDYPPPYEVNPQQTYGGVPPNQYAQGPQSYPPQVGYPAQNYPGACPIPTQGPQTVIINPPGQVLVGGCPSCRVGVLVDDFTCCGIVCAILFFPIGILCCLAMRERRCTNCHATFA